MLFVYAYSKWPEIVMIESTTAETMIKQLQKIFSTHGLDYLRQWSTVYCQEIPAVLDVMGN